MRARFVPRIVFTGAIVGVVPACHGAGPPEMIVLAVQGFSGGAAGSAGSATTEGSGGAGGSSAGNGGSSGTAGASSTSTPSASAVEVVPPKRPPDRPHVIVLAVQGFKGKGTGSEF